MFSLDDLLLLETGAWLTILNKLFLEKTSYWQIILPLFCLGHTFVLQVVCQQSTQETPKLLKPVYQKLMGDYFKHTSVSCI